MVKVSICIPAYKQPDFLKRCLDSILEQEFSDFEVIITDDSPDDTIKKLVETYSDSRIHYFKNEMPLGSPENWNEGMRRAKGKYIKILHHDDWFVSPRSLGKFVGILDNNPESNIAFAGSRSVYSDKHIRNHTASMEFVMEVAKEPETLYLANLFGAPSACIFRNEKNFFFDTKMMWVVDVDFYIQSIKNSRFVYTPEILVNIGISETQATNYCKGNTELRIKEEVYLYNKLNLLSKSFIYRNKFMKVLGREKIFGNKSLKKILPDTDIRISFFDSIIAYYFYTLRKIRLTVSKPKI